MRALPAAASPTASGRRSSPSNPYAASKAAQEALATAYWRTYSLPVVVINCMNMIGEMQHPEKFLPTLIRLIDAGETVTIHGTPGDIGSRGYLHATSAADAVLHILRTLPPATWPHTDRPDRYNVTGCEQIGNLELALMVAEILGKPLRYRLEDFHSCRPGHDPHYGLDGSKLAATGWKPPAGFAESLEQTVRWSLEHRQWLG